ncbi:hypothetical protein D3C87_1911470 [compost metagenome]
MLDAVAGLVQDGDHVGDGLVGLLDDAAGNDLAVFHGHLAGNIEPAIGFNGAGKGQSLAAGACLFGSITFDRHASSMQMIFFIR